VVSSGQIFTVGDFPREPFFARIDMPGGIYSDSIITHFLLILRVK